jgi:hypothetical protein
VHGIIRIERQHAIHQMRVVHLPEFDTPELCWLRNVIAAAVGKIIHG